VARFSRQRRGTLALAALVLAATGPAPGGEVPADLTLLSLAWARGEYRAPLVCEIEGTAHRGLRRVLVSPGPRDARPISNRLAFFDLEVPAGTRCSLETGEEQPNLVGSVFFTLEAVSRPDIAARDFEAALRRDGGFEFTIRSGRLGVGPPGDPLPSLRQVDFAGGRARLHLVERGSDAFRRMASLPAPRKLSLQLGAPDGTRIDLDLAQLAEQAR
jgi:hypothetical protein